MDKTFLLTLLSPILIFIGGLITWFIKSRRDDVLIQEEKAREFKIKTYEVLLEPFITVFTFTLSEKEKEKGIGKMKTFEYRQAGFNLITFGSDDVIISYNKIMQAFYTINYEDQQNKEEYAKLMLRYISDLLLNIRKDLYSKKTKLKRSEMLEFMMKDIKKYADVINN